MRVWIAVAILLLPAVARADRAADLREADRLLADGSYDRAEAAAGAIALDPATLPAERAQAQRIRGLSLFFLGRRDDAEQALRAYLGLEPDAHLDPALVPPEAVVFFEEVRARHAGEVRAAKPRPKKKRWIALNFLPAVGQFQNGQPVKGAIIGGVEAALLATNVTTYAMLKSSCNANLTCDRDTSSARTLRTLNLVSAGLFVGVYAYGVIDGLVGYRIRERAESAPPPVRVGVVPTAGGALFTLGVTTQGL
jgi:hypothetical protein